MKIVQIGHPLLRRKAASVKGRTATPALVRFTNRMVKTMRGAQGVGLAANQVAVSKRLIVLECRSNPRYPRRGNFPLQACINPQIVEYSKRKVWDWEGCLSVPGYRGKVPRSAWIRLKARTLDGKIVTRLVKGFEARVFQHEVDHLNGLIYMDRMPHLRDWMSLEEFKDHR